MGTGFWILAGYAVTCSGLVLWLLAANGRLYGRLRLLAKQYENAVNGAARMSVELEAYRSNRHNRRALQARSKRK